MIAVLKSQVTKAREEKAVVEAEFSEYRKRTQVLVGVVRVWFDAFVAAQRLLCELTAARAEQWLVENEQQ